MSRQKISFTVYLEPEQNELLADLARRTRIVKAVLVREALDDLAEKYRENGTLPRAISAKKLLREKEYR